MRIGAAIVSFSLGSLAAAAETRFDSKVTMAVGYDSNAYRTWEPQESPSAFTLVSAIGEGFVRGEQMALDVSYAAGAKGFVPEFGASEVAQTLDATWGLRLPLEMRFGVEAKEKTINSAYLHDRDFGEAGAVSFVEAPLARGLLLRLNLGLRQYWYFADKTYDSFGPEMSAVLRFFPARRHVFFAASSLSPRHYAGYVVEGTTREDTEVFSTAGYAYRGPIAVQASYEFFGDFSNAPGERFFRHRILGALGGKIPGIDVYANLMAILLTGIYPDGVYFPNQDKPLQDDERFSSVSATLARRLGERWEIQAGYSVYVSLFLKDAKTYLRHVASVGTSVRF